MKIVVTMLIMSVSLLVTQTQCTAIYSENKKIDVHMKDDAGNTPLHLAAQSENFKRVQELVEAGAHLDEKNEKSETPFQVANCISANGKQIRTYLVNNTLLFTYAGMNNAGGIRELLENKKVFVNARKGDGYTPLMYAAEHNNLEIVQLFLYYQAHIDAQNRNGDTALHLAAFLNHKDVVEVLLKAGVDKTKKNKVGETAFDKAKTMNYEEICTLLKP